MSFRHAIVFSAALSLILPLGATSPSVSAPTESTPAEAPTQVLELTDVAGDPTDVATAALEEPGSAGQFAVGLGWNLNRLLTTGDPNAGIDAAEDAAILTTPLDVDPFMVAGVTWDSGQPLGGHEVWMRVREAGSWSEWYELEDDSDGGPDGVSGTAGTEVFVSGSADAIQIRVTGDPATLPPGMNVSMIPAMPAGEEVLDPETVDETTAPATGAVESEPTQDTSESYFGTDAESAPVEPVDPSTTTPTEGPVIGETSTDPQADPSETPAPSSESSPSSTEPSPSISSSQGTSAGMSRPIGLPTATPPPIDVISRAEWDAPAGVPSWAPSYAYAPFVVVHHTAGTNNYTASGSYGIVRGIEYYHRVTRNWGDIGYNLLIDKYGQVFEGRYGTLSGSRGSMVAGAHAAGFNTGSMGISMMGDYSSVTPSTSLVDAVGRMAGWHLSNAGVSPTGYGQFVSGGGTKYAAGTPVTLPRIMGHRNVGLTACPGDAGYSQLSTIRSVATSTYNSVPTPAPTPPDPRGVTAINNWLGPNSSWTAANGPAMASAQGGVYQRLTRGGVLYWHPTYGLHRVDEPVLTAWGNYSWQSGSMGYPIGDATQGRDGSYHQAFAGGTAYWTGSRATFISGEIRDQWGAEGFEDAPAGLPTSPAVTSSTGTYQRFVNGVAYFKPGVGAHFVYAPVLNTWGQYNWQDGIMGYPRSAVGQGPDGSYHQVFEGGIAYWQSGSAHFIRNEILNKWASEGWEASRAGLPISEQYASSQNGVFQRFENGLAYWTQDTGAHFVYSPMLSAWGEYNWQDGVMGYPTSDVTTIGGVQVQEFQWGTAVASSSSQAVFTSGASGTKWSRLGGVNSPAGIPTAEAEPSVNNGYLQRFSQAVAYWTPSTGARFVADPVLSAWGRYNWQEGIMGYPAGDAGVGPDGSHHQIFQGGIAYWRSGSAHFVRGDILDKWAQLGYERSFAGIPTSEPVLSIRGGVYQRFENAVAYWRSGSVYFVSDPVLATWGKYGYQNGTWGYPIGDAGITSSGLNYQAFEGGLATWTGSGPVSFTPGIFSPVVDPNTTFVANDIMSDAVMYNRGSMTTSQIQSVLDARGSACVPNPSTGTACLNDYTENSPSMAVPGCAPYYGAPNESAAQIIARAADACNVNPTVLITMLQKEQGLVTASGYSLTPTRYAQAMGLACPDTGVCDPAQAGFARQVYGAAGRLVTYRDNPTRYNHAAGRTSYVGYNPNSACGGTYLTMANSATAALYNYTPYQPNAAALANMYGSGDSCSTYGNRNFWRIYTEWFGPTH